MGVTIIDREAFVTALLDEEGIAATHGAAFMNPENFHIFHAVSIEFAASKVARSRRFCERPQQGNQPLISRIAVSRVG